MLCYAWSGNSSCSSQFYSWRCIQIEKLKKTSFRMKFYIEIQFVQVFFTLLLAWGWWLNQWRPFQTAVTEEISKSGWPASQVPQLPRTPVASGLGNLTSGLQPFDLLFKCAFSFHNNLCSKILLLRNTRLKKKKLLFCPQWGLPIAFEWMHRSALKWSN